MSIHKLLFCLISLLFLISSCRKLDLPEIDLPEQELDTVFHWKVPLHQDTLGGLSSDHVYFDGERVILTFNLIDGIKSANVQCFDTIGNQLWVWDKIKEPAFRGIIRDANSLGTTYVVNDGQSYFGIDIETGNTKWVFESEHSGIRVFIDENNLIQIPIKHTTSSPKSTGTSLWIGKENEDNFRKIFEVETPEDADGTHITSSRSYINKEGDTILVFQNNTLTISPYTEVIDLYSYNLTQNVLMWHLEKLVDNSWNAHQLQLDESHIYFATKYKVYQIDKLSGEIKWEKHLHWDFQGSNYLLHNDAIYICLDNGDLVAIDKHTGEYLWINQGLAYCCTHLQIYNDRLYMGNTFLYIIDINTGELIMKYKSPSNGEPGISDAYFFSGVIVNEEVGMMYSPDVYYLVAMRLPQ